MAIGHVGGGPADDVGAVPTPAPATPPPADPPLVPDPLPDPATDADAVRFLEQATWGPTAADVAHVKAVGFRAYLNEQFNAPVTNPAKGSNYPDLVFPLEDQELRVRRSNPGDPNYNQTVCNRDNFSMYPLQRTFFSECALRPGSVAAARRLCVAPDSGRLGGQRSQSAKLDDGLPAGARPQCVWQLPHALAGDHADSGDGRISRHAPEHAEQVRTRTSRARYLQLFSIGTEVLNPDGTPQLDAQGMPLASYSQTDVNEFTRVFTGWNFNPGHDRSGHCELARSDDSARRHQPRLRRKDTS